MVRLFVLLAWQVTASSNVKQSAKSFDLTFTILTDMTNEEKKK
ncbi:hypothetical protein T12_547 [Trichinella patagoniensis]|uniref:Uncharacterized protein n=1 Tax=Trichinella patagoniensis TaxID=990121 RepID=A0A0V0YT27_9BILA|nr:hypothetical protein T12_547 [Trichinella patagoniensis]